MPKRNTKYAQAVEQVDERGFRIDHDRHRCQYEIDGMRCTAPGTMCESAVWGRDDKRPERTWLCITHFRMRGDQLGSREALHDLVAHPPAPPEDWRAKMLEERGLGDLRLAWRDMSDEQKQTLKAETIRKCRSFVRGRVVREQPGSGTVRHVVAERERQIDAIYRAMSTEERAAFDLRCNA